MSSKKPELTLFVDIVSPFAYMAFHMTQKSKVFEQCNMTYIPIFLGGVMRACDNTPPIKIKNKGKYIEKDRKRWAKYCNIPFASSMPENFPPNTLHVMRAVAQVEQQYPEKLTTVISALYTAMWVDLKSIQEPAIFEDIMASILGKQEAKNLVEESKKQPAKDKLTANTDLAVQQGAFGLPWFVATNAAGQAEGFWGFDRLGQVLQHLGLDKSDANELRAML